jgi:DeoR family fructose operon transcriptional repressor
MVVPEKRRLEIKEIIKKDKSVSVADLSRSYKVSELTIRRDLKKLEDTGFLEKVHGGAIARGSRLASDPDYMDDMKLNRRQKEKIAEEAARRISDRDIVIIESGTTCQELVHNLELKEDLIIFTASIPIAYELWKRALNRSDMEVNICGGLVELKSNALIGSQATNYFQNISADIAFIGAIAVSVSKGTISTNSQLDADVTRAIAANSRKIILLADSSKFENTGYITTLPLSSFDEIITDKGLDKKTVSSLKKLGIKTTIV